MNLLALRMGTWGLGDGAVFVGTKMQRVEADRCCQSFAIHGDATSSLDSSILGTIISLVGNRMPIGRSCVLTPSLGVSRGLELRIYVPLGAIRGKANILLSMAHVAVLDVDGGVAVPICNEAGDAGSA